MTAINFDLLNTDVTPQTARVWTKTSWAAAWTERADLIPVDVQWMLAPDSNTATLIKKFGRIKQPGATTYATVAPETTRGYFVLIEIPADDPLSTAAWYWLGYAESPITNRYVPARDGLPVTGEQTIPCFGMDALLRQTWLNSTVHVDPDTPTQLKRSDGAVAFNASERGNRHTSKLILTVDGDDSPSAYGFGEPHDDLDTWSSRDIIEHLAAFHLPTVGGIVTTSGVPFAITGADALPTWDAPRIETENRSVYDVLSDVIRSDKLLSWTMGAIATAGSPPTITSVEIHIETALSSALTIPGFAAMRANARVHTVTASTDPLTQIDVIEDDSAVVDQLIVQGPREIGIGTFRLTDGVAAGEIEKAWTPTHYTSYENGADGVVTGWASKQQYNQRADNDRIRGEYPLSDVFRKFKLNQQWDGTAGGTGKDVFEPLDDGMGGTTPFVPYLGSCRFLPFLPLYTEVDYTGDVSLVDESAGREVISPLIAIEDPSDSVVRSIDQINRLKAGFNAKHSGIAFSIRLSVAPDTVPSIELDVEGGPPHAIAGSGFTGNDADVPQEHFGGWDYKTIQATLAMESPRRSQVALPASLSGADVYRRKYITIAAPSLRRVHLAAGTIVGFDDDLTSKTSSGGVLRDPTAELTAIATIFSEFYLNTRKRVLIRTARRPMDFGVGDMVQSITPFGTVNVQVRSIRVAIPLQGQGRPITEITAASSLFDPMQLFVGIEKKKAAPKNRESPNRFRRRRAIAEDDSKRLDAIARDFMIDTIGGKG